MNFPLIVLTLVCYCTALKLPVLKNNKISQFRVNVVKIPGVRSSSSQEYSEDKKDKDSIFGSDLLDGGSNYEIRNGRKYKKITSDDRSEVMKGFYQLRLNLLADNIFVFSIGLCLAWYFGTIKDAFSFGVGGMLGIIYATLLGRYVEGLGDSGGGGGGNARFVPVILLIVLFGKFREQIAIIPELLGFFSYKIAPLLQIFDESGSDDASGK